MKRIIKSISAALVILSLFFVLPAPLVLADAADDICSGVGVSPSDCGSGAADTQVSGTIATVIDIFSMIVGVVAVIMIIVSGLKYVTSSGDSNNVNSAKNTLLYAVIGIVVVVLAQAISRFAIKKAG